MYSGAAHPTNPGVRREQVCDKLPLLIRHITMRRGPRLAESNRVRVHELHDIGPEQPNRGNPAISQPKLTEHLLRSERARGFDSSPRPPEPNQPFLDMRTARGETTTTVRVATPPPITVHPVNGVLTQTRTLIERKGLGGLDVAVEASETHYWVIVTDASATYETFGKMKAGSTSSPGFCTRLPDGRFFTVLYADTDSPVVPTPAYSFDVGGTIQAPVWISQDRVPVSVRASGGDRAVPVSNCDPAEKSLLPR